MSSTTPAQHGDFFFKARAIDVNNPAAAFAGVLVPFGRVLFASLFIFSGLGHFRPETIGYASQQGVPMAGVLVPLSGLLVILGGFSILLGFKARLGALLIILFLVPVTLMMHNFWTLEDAMMRQMQLTHFMKNISLLGSAILICFFGAGPSNVDSWVANRKLRKKQFDRNASSTEH